MGFKILSVSDSCFINWNNFELNIPENFTGMCYIYVNGLSGSVHDDIEKITKIKNINGINEIIISSNNFEVAKYFNLLLKGFDGKKIYNLLNDFDIKNRTELDFSNLNYEEVTIPFDYIMYIKQIKGITGYNLMHTTNKNIITIDTNKQKSYPNIQEIVNSIIDEIFGRLPMNQLDDIDKSVLVSNWIQKNIQFIKGKITNVAGRLFICDDYEPSDDTEDIMTVANKHFGVCNGIAKLSVALLSNPRVGCKCNMVRSPGHAYFTQIIDNEIYGVDNTWCITRNPNHVDECLMAASFSDTYLLIGKDKLNEDEDTMSHHLRQGIYKGEITQKSLPRERIHQSIEKLKALGVSFEYHEQPIFIQYEEKKISSDKHK